MTNGRDRDRQHDDCLDAETLAAWADGGLDPAAAAMAEAHVSSCERCQEIVGLMAHTATVPDARVAAPGLPWWRQFRAGWLIPLTAGVAAVGLWMIVPAERPASRPQAPPLQADAAKSRDEAPAAPTAAPAEPVRERQAPRPQQAPVVVDQLAKSLEKPDASKNKEEKQLADRQAARVDALAETVTVVPQAPAAVVAAPQALGRVNAKAASREIASPNPRTRWRLLDGGNVDYTSDGGANWEAVATGVTDRLTAGSSPTADVCWIVGDNGIVLLTTDGRRWQHLAFPETMDLAAVQATDSRSALVTTADGMLFQTRDGGLTWTRP